MKAPEIRLGYGPIISITVFFIYLLLKNLNLLILSPKIFQVFTIIFMFVLIYDNRNNIDNFNEKLFERKFDYDGIQMIYSSNSFEVYRPLNEPFCNFFEGFCSYQGYKVIINKILANYYLIENKW